MPSSTMSFRFLLALNLAFLISVRVNAQVKPDSTLGNESSTVIPNQTVKGASSDIISGGALRGKNLFHSFENFNVNSGQGIYFINPSGVTNILTRVTGKNPSKIFGILGVLGNANLFFLNPNGIFFGHHASLDLNGSFLATTANSINMSDGTVFSAREPQTVPLLTVNVPIGLDFTGNQGSINVQGEGFHLSKFIPNSRILTPLGGSITTGLRLRSGNTISLVGGSVNFDGGVITAPSGSIKIGSVSSGQVEIKFTPVGWNLDYSKVQQYRNIRLDRISLLDASGNAPGGIYLQGRDIELLNGSFIFLQNQGSQSGGNVVINAMEHLLLNGRESNTDSYVTYASNQNASGILTQNLLGQGPSIHISTKDLILRDGGTITAEAPFSGSGGDITINALNSAKVIGFSPLDPIHTYSDISARADKLANAGNISIHANSLSIVDGAFVSSTTLGFGNAGEVSVNASQSVFLQGYNPSLLSPTYLSSNTYGAGNAGNLFVNAPQLTLLNGGVIASLTLASGSAGSVIINAPDIVNISGTIPGAMIPSLIIASAGKIDSSSFRNLQQVLRVPSTPSGNSGSVTVTTKELNVDNGAQVTVRNDGTGKAGTLQINARSIFLDKQGGITASTASGAGGDIILHLANQLSLNHKSLITATAGGQGKGGNITIDPQQTIISNGSGIAVNSTGTGNAGQLSLSTGNLTLNNGGFLSANTNGGEGGNITVSARDFRLERGSYIDASALGGTKNGGNITLNTDTLETLDSSIIKANAFGGPGGNIQVNAQGLFRSPYSVISASSRYGINGTVQINTPYIDFARAAANPVTPPQTPQLGSVCSGRSGSGASSLVYAGTGGTPPSSSDPLSSSTAWHDNSLPPQVAENSATPPQPTAERPVPIIEAQGWIRRPNGVISLVAEPSGGTSYSSLSAPPCQQAADH